MNAREYTTIEAQRELERRGCPHLSRGGFVNRVVRQRIGRRRKNRIYLTAAEIDELAVQLGVRRSDEYSVDEALADLARRTGKILSAAGFSYWYKKRSAGRRVGRRRVFSGREVDELCAHYGAPAAPLGAGAAVPSTTTRAPVPGGTYNSVELCTEIYRRTGRRVRNTWLGHHFPPGDGLRWTGEDLVHICAYLDAHAGIGPRPHRNPSHQGGCQCR